MNKSSSSDKEEFQQDLNRYRSILQAHRARLDEDPLMGKHLDFWLESAQFYISELEIWDDLGNREKYDQTVRKLREILRYLHDLISQLTEKDDIPHDVSENTQ